MLVLVKGGSAADVRRRVIVEVRLPEQLAVARIYTVGVRQLIREEIF